MIWSIACMAKLKVMNSTIGLRPANAAPTPSPVKAVLGDRRVDHARGAEFLQQALGDLVGALILGDLLADDEDGLVAPHFLRHGVAQRFAHGHGDHLGAGGHVRLGRSLQLARRAGLGRRRRRRRLDLHLRLFGLGGRRGGRRLLPARRGTAVGQRGGVLALAQDHGDRRIDRHVVGSFRHQNFSERALVDRLDLHGGFVGLDLGDHVAGFDGVAFFLEPLGEIALLHRGRERGHEDFNRHRASPR